MKTSKIETTETPTKDLMELVKQMENLKNQMASHKDTLLTQYNALSAQIKELESQKTTLAQTMVSMGIDIPDKPKAGRPVMTEAQKAAKKAEKEKSNNIAPVNPEKVNTLAILNGADAPAPAAVAA